MSAEEVELDPLTKRNSSHRQKNILSGDSPKAKNRKRLNRDRREQTKKSDWEFILVSISFQVVLLILYGISSDYADGTIKAHDPDEEFGTEPYKFYSMFQDVHAMMFVGFGFLMTFLRKYGFGALTFNFILCAYGIQWGIYIFHMIPWIFGDNTPGKLEVTAYKLVDGDIATAVVLISFGALLGRTNPAQLLVICFFELIFWAINFHICVSFLGIIDVGGSIVVHTFGAYFGLAVSYWIGKTKNTSERKSVYHSDLFSMIGTLFLWLYWPSFNGYFANREYYFMDRAFINTVLGLCGSTVSTFITSRIVKKGKFDMVHVQNATLAGGVAVGAAADLYLHPTGAIATGIFAGVLSVIGYEYLSDYLEEKWNISDTCGIHNLHGMPGVLGGIVSAIALAAADGKGHYVDITHEDYPFGSYSLSKQAGYQMAAVCVTMCFAIISGSLTALSTIRWMTFPSHEFQDEDNYNVPGPDKDYLRGTIRKQHFAQRSDFDELMPDDDDHE
eukprot:929633_1